MNVLKDHFEKLIAGLAALFVLASAALLIMKAGSFNAVFSAIQGNVTKSADVGSVDLIPLADSEKCADNPAAWVWSKSSLFVSQKYVVKEGKLINPIRTGGDRLHDPVPNEWFAEFELDILDPDSLAQDTDGDGFDNRNEWENKTSPTDKNSHAPFITKLRLAKFIQVPFRLIFMARPDDETFQINVVDVRGQPTQYRKIGEKVDGTKFKVLGFEEKSAKDSQGSDIDISELTLQNEETGRKIVLIKERTVNDPDSYGEFSYLWNNSTKRVKLEGTFSLEPETDIEYKLIDINASQAVIENTKTGAKTTIPKL
jgi:hypothetical protein